MSLLTAPEMKASTLIGIFTSYFLSLMFPQRICWSGGRFPKMSIFLSFTWQNMFSNPSSSWGKLKRGWFYNCVVNFNFNLPLYSTQDVAVSSDFMWACRKKKKKKDTQKVCSLILKITRGVNKACSLWMMRSLAEIIGLCCNDLKTGITHHILKSWTAQP